jgi:hypothetical protein
MLSDPCADDCPCWAQGRLPEPITGAEAELARDIQRSVANGGMNVEYFVLRAAASVARGAMDKRRVAILLSAMYAVPPRWLYGYGFRAIQSTALALCLPSRKTSGFKYPRGVSQLMQLGVCLKSGFRGGEGYLLSPLEWVLRDILSLKRSKSRKKSLCNTPTLNLLVEALAKDPVHIYRTLARLAPDDVCTLHEQCSWVKPCIKEAKAELGRGKAWAAGLRRAWLVVVLQA